MQELEQALNNHEGCQLIGTLQLKRMAGVLGISIHIQDFMALPEVRCTLCGCLQTCTRDGTFVRKHPWATAQHSHDHCGQTLHMACTCGMVNTAAQTHLVTQNAEQLKAALERQHEENAKREPGSEQQAPVQPRVADVRCLHAPCVAALVTPCHIVHMHGRP